MTAAAHAQLDRLWHASNLYWTEPMLRLAGLLSDRLGVATVEEMLAAGRFEGGIVPKLNAALSAVRAGVIASIGRTEVVA